MPLQTMKEIGVSDCTVPSDIKDSKVGSTNKRPFAVKNTEIVLLPCPI